MSRTEQDIYRLHMEITRAFEECTRTHNRDWLVHFWEVMMDEANMSRQDVIDLLLDEINRGNRESEMLLRSILDNTPD